MGKRPGKQEKTEPFVKLNWELIDSKAWKSLNSHSVQIYIEIKRKFNGRNGNNLSFTYSEAEQLMARNTFSKAINDLVAHGIIDVVRSGGLYRQCNIFALSDRWKEYEKKNFDPEKRYVPSI